MRMVHAYNRKSLWKRQQRHIEQNGSVKTVSKRKRRNDNLTKLQSGVIFDGIIPLYICCNGIFHFHFCKPRQTKYHCKAFRKLMVISCYANLCKIGICRKKDKCVYFNVQILKENSYYLRHRGRNWLPSITKLALPQEQGVGWVLVSPKTKDLLSTCNDADAVINEGARLGQPGGAYWSDRTRG